MRRLKGYRLFALVWLALMGLTVEMLVLCKDKDGVFILLVVLGLTGLCTFFAFMECVT